MNKEIIDIKIREAYEKYQKVSASYLQRVCKISYVNAVKCIEIWVQNNLEKDNVD